MNSDELQKKLIAAARRHPASDEVPFAFEQRIMARLAGKRTGQESFWWVRALWWGACACSAIALAVSIWAFAPGNDSEVAATFSQEFEQTILAATEDEELTW